MSTNAARSVEDTRAEGARFAERHAALARRATPLDRGELLGLFGELAHTGYLGSTIPVEAGGAGLSAEAFGGLMEGLATRWPFLANHSVQRYLHELADEPLRARWLPRLLRGEAVAAVAITEPGSGSDVQSVATTAVRDGDDYVLNGVKTWITHGEHADVVLVLAQSEAASPDGRRGFTRILVEREQSAFATTPIPTTGLRPVTFSEIRFTDTRVPVSNRLGTEGRGIQETMGSFAMARAMVAAQAVGVAGAAVAHTIAFVRERRRFGRPLAEQQAVQFALADAAVRTDAIRALTYETLRAIPALGRDAAARAAGVKYLAADTALRVCDQMVDLHGASGLVDGEEVARLAADARMLTVVDGTANVNRLVLARSLLAEDPPARGTSA